MYKAFYGTNNYSQPVERDQEHLKTLYLCWLAKQISIDHGDLLVVIGKWGDVCAVISGPCTMPLPSVEALILVSHSQRVNRSPQTCILMEPITIANQLRENKNIQKLLLVYIGWPNTSP